MPAPAGAAGVGVGEVGAADVGQPVQPAPGGGPPVAGDQWGGGVHRGGQQRPADRIGRPGDRHRAVQGRAERHPGPVIPADRGGIGAVGVQRMLKGPHQVRGGRHVRGGRQRDRVGLDQRDRPGRRVGHRGRDQPGVPAGQPTFGQRGRGGRQQPARSTRAVRTSPAASPAVTRVVCRSQAPAVSAPSRVKVPRASTSPTADSVTDSSRLAGPAYRHHHLGELVVGQVRRPRRRPGRRPGPPRRRPWCPARPSAAPHPTPRRTPCSKTCSNTTRRAGHNPTPETVCGQRIPPSTGRPVDDERQSLRST